MVRITPIESTRDQNGKATVLCANALCLACSFGACFAMADRPIADSATVEKRIIAEVIPMVGKLILLMLPYCCRRPLPTVALVLANTVNMAIINGGITNSITGMAKVGNNRCLRRRKDAAILGIGEHI